MIKKLAILGLAIVASTAGADEIQLEDGRKIKLYENGTWTYVSSDRLLATPDGRQVRVRDDGTWEYTGAAAPVPTSGSAEVTRALMGDMVLALKTLAIETSRSSNHKNTHKQTQTVFEVSLVNNGAQAGEIRLDSSVVRVEDTSGREYEILRISPQALSLAPGEKALLEVRADGSPHWFTTKAMELHIAREDGDDVVLKGLMSSAKKRELKSD